MYLFNAWEFMFFDGMNYKHQRLGVEFNKSKQQAIKEFEKISNCTVVDAKIVGKF